MKVSTLIRVYLVILTATLISCKPVDSDDVNQQKIRTSYYLQYDADKDETLAYATFQFGSSYVRLKDPAYVSFQSDRLIKNDALGIISYDLTYRGFKNAGSFYYRDGNGDEYHNNAVLVEPLSFNSESSTLSASQGGELFWDGVVLTAGQTVGASIYTSSATISFSTEAIGANSIRISADQITDESKGDIKIKLCRGKSFGLSEATQEGGSIHTEFCSEKVDFIITD